MTTYEEILAAAKTVAGFKEKTVESDEDYLKDLAKLVAVVDDATWNGLSQQAQKWYNMAVKAVNGGQKLPECPGYTYSAVQEEPPKPELKKPAAPKTENAPVPVSNGRAARTPGAIDAVRRVVIKHLDWNIEQVYNHLVQNGFPTVSRATVEVNVGDIKKVINVAKELGWTPPQKKHHEEPQAETKQ